MIRDFCRWLGKCIDDCRGFVGCCSVMRCSIRQTRALLYAGRLSRIPTPSHNRPPVHRWLHLDFCRWQAKCIHVRETALEEPLLKLRLLADWCPRMVGFQSGKRGGVLDRSTHARYFVELPYGPRGIVLDMMSSMSVTRNVLMPLGETTLGKSS